LFSRAWQAYQQALQAFHPAAMNCIVPRSTARCKTRLYGHYQLDFQFLEPSQCKHYHKHLEQSLSISFWGVKLLYVFIIFINGEFYNLPQLSVMLNWTIYDTTLFYKLFIKTIN
jgi:hypothetical protein